MSFDDERYERYDGSRGLIMLRCEGCGAEFGSEAIDCPNCGSAHTSYASEDARRANDFNRPRWNPR